MNLWPALYPLRCALCGRLGPDPICGTCGTEVQELALTEPSDGPAPVNLSIAAYDYTGRAAHAVRRLKYDRVLTHVGVMASEMNEAATRCDLLRADAFLPVPIHWTRACERGFNQAEVLAEKLPNVKSHWLRRKRRTRQQVGLSPEMRLVNLMGAFEATTEVKDGWIVLVDDVTTSGGTAKECAKALLASGAYRVDLLTYCRGGAINDL